MLYSRTYVAIGSNVPGSRGVSRDMVRTAIARLAETGSLRSSKLYSTPAVPKGSGPDFVNAVVEVAGEASPAAILRRLHDLEAEYGRIRKERWGPRTIDLDLLAVGDMVLPDSETQDVWRNLSPERQIAEAPDRLILPHPRLQNRAFVLVPWADIAPDWTHPRTGLSVARMLEMLAPEDLRSIRPVAEDD